MLTDKSGRHRLAFSSQPASRARPKRREKVGLLPPVATRVSDRGAPPEPQAGAELLTIVLQKLVEAYPEGIAVLDDRGQVAMANQAWRSQEWDVIPCTGAACGDAHSTSPFSHRGNDGALRIAKPVSRNNVVPGPPDLGHARRPASPAYVSSSSCGCAADDPDLTEIERLRRERVILIDAISNSAERERRRIGREMHDSTLQDLIAVGLILRQLKHLECDGTVKEAFAEIRGLLYQAQQEVRTLSYLLHPPLLAEGGLESVLKSLVRGLATRMNIQIDCECDTAGERPPAEIEIALYRVAQEALINVHKHAFATHVVVQYHVKDNNVILEVRDNGVGLGGRSGYPVGTGVGIEGMRSRLEQLHGTLKFSRLRHGVLLRAVVPLRRSLPG